MHLEPTQYFPFIDGTVRTGIDEGHNVMSINFHLNVQHVHVNEGLRHVLQRVLMRLFDLLTGDELRNILLKTQVWRRNVDNGSYLAFGARLVHHELHLAPLLLLVCDHSAMEAV